MPNFDQFERLVRASMVSPVSGIADFAIPLSDIEDSNRPRIFKNKSPQELERWVKVAHEKLRRIFGKEVEFSTTNVNIRGADLYIEDKNQWIELKTGSVTDANPGISTISWAMGDDDDSELSQIMSHSMIERRMMAEAGDLNGVRSSQDNTMDKLENYFRERLTENELAPPFLCHYSRCVARCVTKKDESISFLNTPEAEWATPRVFYANWKDGWNEISRPFDIDEDIIVTEIVRKISHSGQRSLKVPRAQFRVKGVSSNRTALYYPNYKNSYKTLDGKRIEAKHWVRTACFHVWIDR